MNFTIKELQKVRKVQKSQTNLEVVKIKGAQLKKPTKWIKFKPNTS